jgi:hypothetical protein
MTGTAFGIGPQTTQSAQYTPWGPAAFGSPLGTSPFGPQLQSYAQPQLFGGYPNIPLTLAGQPLQLAQSLQSISQLLQVVPQQLQQLQYAQQQQLQQLQQLLQSVPQQLQYLQQLVQSLPQQVHQLQQPQLQSPQFGVAGPGLNVYPFAGQTSHVM